MASLAQWDPFRWDPFREMEELGERINRMLSRLPLRLGRGDRESLTLVDWTPAVDISETDSEYLIKAEVPEVNKKDIKVTLQNGVLTIQGERRQEKEDKGRRFHRVERSYGSFARSFTLPGEVDEQTLKAEFKDGILLVHVPKSGKATPKAIEVKVD